MEEVKVEQEEQLVETEADSDPGYINFGEKAMYVEAFFEKAIEMMGTTTPESMAISSEIFRICLNLALKASSIHAGFQIPWAEMCYAAGLKSKTSEMRHSVYILQIMLKPLKVGIIAPKEIKKGCGLPNFYVLDAKKDEKQVDLTKLGE